jgi:hypothetical protein
MNLHKNVVQCHEAKQALESKGITSHWIRFDIKEMKFKFLTSHFDEAELVIFDEKNSFKRKRTLNYLNFNEKNQKIVFYTIILYKIVILSTKVIWMQIY